MPHKSLIMAGWQVRAIYNGADVTRRLMNPQPPGWCTEFGYTCFTPAGHISFRGIYGEQGPAEKFFKLPCRKGDVLRVCEAWRARSEFDHLKPSRILWTPGDHSIRYEEHERSVEQMGGWGRYRHARSMCKWMARLWLRVTEDPYPERVRDITEAEAIREGVFYHDGHGVGHSGYRFSLDGCIFDRAVDAFHDGWNGIHGPDSWERDWDWRYAFERTEARQC